MVPATLRLMALSDSVVTSRDREHFLDHSERCQNRDLELVRRIAASDDSALRALFASYGQRMYAYAVRLTRNATLAEDVVQESLVAAWQSAAHYRGQGRVIAWLLGIVHHKALNAIRRKSPLLLNEETEELDSGTEPLEDQMVGFEQAALLRTGMESLSLKHRMAIELVFYQGLDLAEAAEVCSCPVGTIKSRLNYAKAYLRKKLELHGIKAEDVR